MAAPQQVLVVEVEADPEIAVVEATEAVYLMVSGTVTRYITAPNGSTWLLGVDNDGNPILTRQP
jgi:hypothetical protein